MSRHLTGLHCPGGTGFTPVSQGTCTMPILGLSGGRGKEQKGSHVLQATLSGENTAASPATVATPGTRLPAGPREPLPLQALSPQAFCSNP